LLFSASLGCLGVLGDMPFHRCFGALTLCTARPQEGIIAEDAEVTEARREKQKQDLPYFRTPNAKGDTVTCPVDDVSYIDLLSNTPPPQSGPGTLTFVMNEFDHDWYSKAIAAKLAKLKLDLAITVKFLPGGVPTAPLILAGTSLSFNIPVETGNSYVITLGGITGISAQASDLDAFARGGDRDDPKAYNVTFSSMQLAPKP
jgi:hypothetical protein